MAEEKLSLSKFIMSFFEWLPWVKTFRYIIGIALVLLLIYFLYIKLFKKPNQTTVFQGNVGKVTISQNQKKVFIPFIEGSAGIKTESTSPEFGIRSGVRFEF